MNRKSDQSSSDDRSALLSRSAPLSALVLGCSLCAWVTVGNAADVSIADTPMASSTSSEIKPNVTFVLDDSGSMAWTHLPDHVKRFAAWEAEDREVGYVTAHCNAIYYNPLTKYVPPVNADGTSFPDVSFNAAPVNGYDSGSEKVNLASNFKAYNNMSSALEGDDPAQSAYYYKYVGSANPVPLSYKYTSSGEVDTSGGTKAKPSFYAECSSRIGSTAAKAAFEKVPVDAAHSEAQNFANWYSYYRFRIYSMKAAAGFAFRNLPNPDTYRIGFSTHSYEGVDSTNPEFLKIADYCGVSEGGDVCEQRSSLYTKLYGATPSGSTPLRPAMSKIGQMYAGKLLTGADDPMQYSCQQNFLILSTDGYWNFGDPMNLSGGLIGDVDGAAGTPTPIRDALAKANTLADTALYYYDIDLRSDALGNCTGAVGLDVCENNVPGAGRDSNNRQHMTTFTLGLGVDGSLKYAENYLEGGSADFNKILDGSLNWPDPTDAEDLHRVDDLWHAAVNGRGTYFSAKTPQSLAQGLSKALSGVSAMSGSGAASATSNLEPVAGDNYAYVASYRTVKWDGDVQAREINLTTGAVSSEDERIWSAKTKLDATLAASRKIYFNNDGVLAEFIASALDDETGAGLFEPCGAGVLGHLTQCAMTDFATTVSQLNVIDYIRGDDSMEDQAGNVTRVLRDRESKLGDIVNSQPVYVKKAPFAYTDVGYPKFAAGTVAPVARQGAVIVGANDGMLHAFNAETGAEMWAFVPTAVMPQLYKLADSNYGGHHRYFVDGPIAVADICADEPCMDNGKGWKTILVAGLGKGGKGYFALDITDTTAPKLLWEFTVKNDADLGYSFGNPIITKVAGQWTVVFASGYNNVEGDGAGRVYMLGAAAGTLLAEILTNPASDPALSGIAKLSNWVDHAEYDNSTQYVYGGDLGGNLWRIDLELKKATRLALLTGPDGAQQSVTTKPELAQVKVGGALHRVVFAGTGRYLGTTDLADMSVQSLYAVKEDLATEWGAFRDLGGVIRQTLSPDGVKRLVSAKDVPWADSPGWFVDFDVVKGERITTDMFLDRGVLAVVANVPEADACNVGGYSYIYFFDYKTGSYVTTAAGGFVGHRLANAIGVGMSVIRVNGKSVAIVTTSDNKHIPVPVPEYSGSGMMKRMLWREMFAS